MTSMAAETYEIVFPRVLEFVATGCTKAETRRYLERTTTLSATDVDALLRDARIEAEACGVEREDIDDSWYRSGRSNA